MAVALAASVTRRAWPWPEGELRVVRQRQLNEVRRAGVGVNGLTINRPLEAGPVGLARELGLVDLHRVEVRQVVRGVLNQLERRHAALGVADVTRAIDEAVPPLESEVTREAGDDHHVHALDAGV